MERLDLLEFPALFPADFFSFAFEVERVEDDFGAKKRFLLTDTHELLAEERFASFYLGWSQEGLFFQAEVDKVFEKSNPQNYKSGDALELFFDTRASKTAFTNQFCHHFLIFPEPIDGIQSKEVSRFRMEEDAHALAEPNALKVELEKHRKSYSVKVFIKADDLHGYDPKNMRKLGFSACVHRPVRPAQHFAISSAHFSIEEHPALWPTCNLKE